MQRYGIVVTRCTMKGFFSGKARVATHVGTFWHQTSTYTRRLMMTPRWGLPISRSKASISSSIPGGRPQSTVLLTTRQRMTWRGLWTRPLMRWLLKPLDKGNESFERLDWKQSACDTGAWYAGCPSKSGTAGWTNSSPCYPLVLVDELRSGLKREVTAISLPPENYMPGCTSQVARRRFSKRGS